MTAAHNIMQDFALRLSYGLRRGSLSSCSKWTEMYRMMGKPFPGKWTFEHHPWLKDMHDSQAELNVGQKSAQVGFTELLLNWSFYSIDMNAESVLYILPTDDNAGDFSSSRFDVALELSPHLSSLFSDVKNAKHKRAGSANLFIRGSRSKIKLISVPVARLAVDELDKMVIENIPLAWERMSGQVSKQAWFVSTPTVDGIGINKYFQESSQEHVFFKCPHCSRSIELTFPDCIIITSDNPNDQKLKDSYYICNFCKGILDNSKKSEWLKTVEWVPSNNNSDIRGFYVNQMYSQTISPYELAKSFLKGQTSPADEQEFYNSKLGLPHIVEGARVNIAEINNCLGTHVNNTEAKGDTIVTMGVDVGKWLHVEIDEWVLDKEGKIDIHSAASPNVLAVLKIQDFEELDRLMFRYNVNHCVIDANPEKRNALSFCSRFYGRASICYYGENVKGKEISKGQETPSVTVDRTAWLDLALDRFHHGKKRIRLPYDVKNEYKEHIENIVKIYSKNKDGNSIASFINGGRDDHFAHSRTYAEIALSLAVSSARSQNITGIM